MKTKKVGIDFHVAGGIYQGVRTYLTDLIEALRRIQTELSYIVYTNHSAGITHWQGSDGRLTLRRLPSPSGRFNLLVGFPVWALRDRIGVFHSQYVLPIWLPCRSIVTIHDILFESHPDFFPTVHRMQQKLFVPLSARRATRIICVSEFTKKQVMDFYGISEKKITVIYEAASRNFRPIRDRKLLVSRLKACGISKKYVLFVGRIEPRKNIVGLLKGFDYMRQRGRKDVSLVIVGKQDKLFEDKDLQSVMKDIPYRSEIVFTGGVSDHDLVALYNGAEIMAYPAFAEGFGLPVLEAMACGTPVVTSNTSALIEVAGDAAVLVDPYSHRDIGQALEGVLENADLRAALSAKGMRQAGKFSWEAAAEATLRVYEEVLEP